MMATEPGRLPDFVIIGAKRSGTTSLTRYLGAHPDVFMARPKEPHFFDLHYDRGLDWYRGLFAGAGTRRSAGEATPTYLYEPTALACMGETLPNARLVAILRNPVDRAYSHYWMRRAKGEETLEFADAIDAEPERIASGGRGAQVGYLDIGRYLPQLLAVREIYPAEALLILMFEEFMRETSDGYRQLCRFIGVADTILPPNLGQRVNSFATFRSLRARDLTRRLARSRGTLGRVAAKAVGRLNAKYGPYPPMDPAIRADLERRFVRANAELAAWLERDLSSWGPAP